MKLRVTSAVLAQGQEQITVTDGPVKSHRKGQKFQVTGKSAKGTEFCFVQGDTNAIWAKHQADRTAFDQLFALLAANPDKILKLSDCKAELVVVRPPERKETEVEEVVI